MSGFIFLCYLSAALFVSYLLGSIPFGLIVGKIGGVGDIRTIGSGNIGATNMLRTGRKSLALLTLFLDFLKGFIAQFFAGGFIATLLIYAPLYSSGDAATKYLPLAETAGALAVIGHVYPVWLRFRGGKGVATFLGMLLGMSPLLFGIAVFFWLATFFLTRYSSLAALISIGAMPLCALILSFFEPRPWDWSCLVLLPLAILIIAKHKQNIIRLLNGTESAFRKKRGNDAAS